VILAKMPMVTTYSVAPHPFARLICSAGAPASSRAPLSGLSCNTLRARPLDMSPSGLCWKGLAGDWVTNI
jgi:hypothetical protein